MNDNQSLTPEGRVSTECPKEAEAPAAIAVDSEVTAGTRPRRDKNARPKRKRMTANVNGAAKREGSKRPKPNRERTPKGGYRHLPSDKPRRKPTKSEIWDRLEFVANQMAQGLREHAIKRKFRTAFGDLAESTAREYLACARERLLRESHQPREVHFSEALSFCRAIRADKSVSPRDRLKAQELLNELLGLDAPREFNMNTDTLPPLISIVVENREQLRELYAANEIDGHNVRLTTVASDDQRSGEAEASDMLETEFRRLMDAERAEPESEADAPVAPPIDADQVTSDHLIINGD